MTTPKRPRKRTFSPTAEDAAAFGFDSSRLKPARDSTCGIGPDGARLKILRPELRTLVIEVLKGSIVYRDLLHPDQCEFASRCRSSYAIHGDDMIMKATDMTALLDIANKLNLRIKL